MDFNKLNNQRSWNARPAPEGGTEFHVGWVNYLDENDKWQEIDCTFQDTGTHFEITKAPFSIKLPKTLKGGDVIFTGDNRFDVHKKEIITDSPFDLAFDFEGADDVPGAIEGEHNDRIVYKNAYPQYNADVVYYVQNHRAPRLRKLVVFNSKPDITEDVRISFFVAYL